MPKSADIVADLDKVAEANKKEGVQINPGYAYLERNIYLQHGDGYQYPIDTFVKYINIQETVFDSGILGYLEMADTYNLVRNGIILGQELLYLKFCTAGAEIAGIEDTWNVDFFKHPLQVYKIEDMKELGTTSGGAAVQTLTYRLHFCSPELLINDRIRISKTIQGTYTDMIKDVLKNHLYTKKELFFEETDDLKKLIIPNLHPMEFINRITQVAQKEVPMVATNPHADVPKQATIFKGRLTDFRFWETTRGYNFLPMIQPEVDSKFTLTCGTTPDGMGLPYFGFLNALSYEYIKHGNTYEQIKLGGWGSKHIQHNAFTKSVKTYQSNYLRSLANQRYSHVSRTPVYLPEDNNFGLNRDEEDRMISDWPDGQLNFSSFQGGNKNTSINRTNREVNTPWTPTPATTDMKRKMQLIHSLGYDQLTVTLNGISSLEAGMTIRLDLPDFGEGSGFFKGTDAKWENRLDNLWIITSIKHQIELPRNSYRCELHLTNTMSHTAKELPIYQAPGKKPQMASYT